MTCGLWGQPGHEGHICIYCTNMYGDCPKCRVGKSCNFKRTTPEILKKRDELFRSKKGERTVIV